MAYRIREFQTPARTLSTLQFLLSHIIKQGPEISTSCSRAQKIRFHMHAMIQWFEKIIKVSFFENVPHCGTEFVK